MLNATASILQVVPHVQVHGFDLGVRFQTSCSQFTANSTLLETTKRDAVVGITAAVDPDRSGLDFAGDPVSSLHVTGEHGGAKAVFAVVRLLDRLFLSLERGNDHEGAEHLFAVDFHVGLDVREDGWFDEVALAVTNLLIRGATGCESGTLRLASLNVGKNTLILCFVHLGALDSVGGEGVTDLVRRCDGFLEGRHELVVDPLLHEDTRCGTANLALITHDAGVSPLDSLCELTVIEHQSGGFATRLESDILQGTSCLLHDLTAGDGGASEGHLVNIWMLDDGGPGILAIAIEEVDHAGRKTSFLDQVGKVENTQRSLLGGLQYDRVSARQCRSQFPADHHQRVIPRNNLAYHTDRLADGIGKFLGGGGNRLAKVLVRPSGIIPEGSKHVGNIPQGIMIGFALGHANGSAAMSTS